MRSSTGNSNYQSNNPNPDINMSNDWSMQYSHPPRSQKVTQENVLGLSPPPPYFCPTGSMSPPSQSAALKRRAEWERSLLRPQHKNVDTRTRRWVGSAKEHIPHAEKIRIQRGRTEIHESRSKRHEEYEPPSQNSQDRLAMFDLAAAHDFGTYKATRPSHYHHGIRKDGPSAIYPPQLRDSDSPGILPPPVNTPVTLFGCESGPMKRLSESQLRSTHDFGDAAFPDEDEIQQAPFGDLPLRDANSSSWSDRDAPFGLYERRDELEDTIRRQQQVLLAHQAIVGQLEHDIEYFEEVLERVETQIVRYRQAWHLEKLNGIAASAARRNTGTRRQVQTATNTENEVSAPHTEPSGATAAASTWLPLTEAGPSKPARLEMRNLTELERREKEQTCCLAHLSERSECPQTLSVMYSAGDESRSDIISISSSNNETDEVQRMGSEKRKVDEDTERLLAERRARSERTRDGLESADDHDMIQAGNDVGMSWKGKGKEL